jgi:hypothetical protein
VALAKEGAWGTLIRAPIGSWIAIALVSGAVVLYEVAITRVLSVVLWYHFAFLSVSLALLGIGAPGVWFALRRPGPRALPASLVAAGVAIPASIVVITKVVGRFPRPEYVDAGALGVASPGILVTVLAILTPMVALGSAVCLFLLRAPGREVGRMYGADLLGATLGAALVVPLLHRVPTPILLASTAFLPLAAAAIVSRPIAPVIVAAAVFATLVWGTPYRLTYTKKYSEEGRILFEKWTPTGRITVFPNVFYETNPQQAFAWGIGDRFELREIEQLWIEQDGSAGTPITRWSDSWNDFPHLFYDVTSVGYQWQSPDRVCVIGSGGGRDVLTAMRAGATEIDAVELNPHILDAVSGPFREFAGDIYRRPGVDAIASEGRSFLTRAEGRYDLIQISMVDSWAATSAGAFALSENYLYTVEAFQLYWDRLAEDGVLSVSRWLMDRHLVEGMRILLLAQEALRREGVEDPRHHLAVVHAKAVMTLLVSKQPFTTASIARLDEICAERGFLRHWPPHEKTPKTSNIPHLLLTGPGVVADTGLDLSPPEDDRPFFFQAVPVFGGYDRELVASLSVNEQSVVLLRQLLWIVSLLTVALFFAPIAVAARVRGEGPGFWRGSLYFVAIGLAFLLVEVPWIQRFVLYLGHPSYATTVVLAALLLGAGAGSIVSSRLGMAPVRRWGLALPVLLAIVNAALDPVFRATLGLPFATRVASSLALLMPAGFLMGFAFPMGMIRFGDSRKAWFWALNGAFSVLASVSSLALSMHLGFTKVAWAGVGLYVVAYGLLAAPAVDAAGDPDETREASAEPAS